MKHSFLQKAEKYMRAHKRKKQWYRVVISLACMVVFCTTYALILPAITMENGKCTLTEHTHSEACYTQVTSVPQEGPVCTAESLNIHQHKASCYDSKGNLTCGYSDFVVHCHDSSCYLNDETLWCPLPEIKTHTHTKSCYEVTQELVCEVESEHEHTDECYRQVTKRICKKNEIILHKHTPEKCFDEYGNLICGKTQVLEHVHTDACFGTVEVPVENSALTCTNTDEAHTHSSLCYGTWELTHGNQF
ncbi:MAG: hypothetical protein ACI4IJ_10715 [Acutalibacteraceae bacterium]